MNLINVLIDFLCLIVLPAAMLCLFHQMVLNLMRSCSGVVARPIPAEHMTKLELADKLLKLADQNHYPPLEALDDLLPTHIIHEGRREVYTVKATETGRVTSCIPPKYAHCDVIGYWADGLSEARTFVYDGNYDVADGWRIHRVPRWEHTA